MDYFIDRDGSQYGPYSLEDLRRMLASRDVLAEDIVRSAYGAPATVARVVGSNPLPYDLHWALVLLIGCLTCGFFWYVWMFVIASHVSKIGRGTKAIIFYIVMFLVSSIGGFFANIVSAVMAALGGDTIGTAVVQIVLLLGVAALTLIPFEIGNFAIKKALEEHYGLKLSPVMTALFSVYYFQYWLSRIAQAEKGRAIPR